MHSSLAQLFLFALIALATADDPEKIVGGRTAVPGQFPYMASLRQGNHHFCGGSIVSAYHILTAAHCVTGKRPNDVTVVTGSIYRTREGGDKYPVAALYPDPGYGSDPDKDIAIIKLARPINFNNLQLPISIATARPPEERYATVSGWGGITAPPSQHPELLQFQYLRMIKFNDCRKIYHGITTAICTYNQENVGTCSGDSGSPLVYNNQVAAVVSRGVLCAKGYPDIYSSTADNMNFIRQAMSR